MFRLSRRQKRKLSVESLEPKRLLAALVVGSSLPLVESPVDGHALGALMSNAEGEMGHGSTGCTSNHDGHGNNGGHTHDGMGHGDGNTHGDGHGALALVPISSASNTAVATGNWSDPATWHGGQVPEENGRVVIPQGLTVTIDSPLEEEFEWIRIDGTLSFATDVNTELRVETLVSSSCGNLVIGSAAAPVSANVSAKIVFVDNGDIDRSADPNLLSRGALLQGTTTIHGAQKSAWLRLQSQPTAGTTQLELIDEPFGWQIGDELVITGTNPDDPTGDELATIASIDGNTVTLTSPLMKDHVAPQSDLDVHVANNTRNVTFTSENPSIQRRGHVMFMHTLDVDVNYAGFHQLGRTDKSIPVDDSEWDHNDEHVDLGGSHVRGRYSVHFHRGGVDLNSDPAKVHGSVVTDDSGWAYVNHSSNVDFTNNVAYNTVGAAYNTEAGDEIGSFINNIAIRTVNPNDPLNNPDPENRFANAPDARDRLMDFGWQGDGFWFHGPQVRVEGNVVSGATGHAYIYWTEPLLEKGLGPAFIDTKNLPNGDLLGPPGTRADITEGPVTSFDNNIAYNATHGLAMYYLHAGGIGPEEGETAYWDQLNSTFSNSTLWGIKQTAVEAPYGSRMTFDNLRIIGSGQSGSIGMKLDHFWNIARFDFNSLDIKGFETGIALPTGGTVTIEGGAFANVNDFRVTNPKQTGRQLTINGVSFEQLPESLIERTNERVNIRLIDDILPEGIDGEQHKSQLFFFQPDQILLNYGEFENAQLYFDEQAGDFIPVTGSVGGSETPIPQQYIGKTNHELAEQFGLAFGGAVLPTESSPATGITGGRVGPQSEMFGPPPFIDPLGDGNGDDNDDGGHDDGGHDDGGQDDGDHGHDDCDIGDDHDHEGGIVMSTVQYGEGATAGGDVPLMMDVYSPEQPSDSSRPVVLLVHGGGFYGGDRDAMSETARLLARRGYVAVSMSYRLAGQEPVASSAFQQMAIESIENSVTEFGDILPAHLASAVEDSVTAMRYLQGQAETFNIDPSRIAVWGESAGAFVGLHLAYAIDDFQIGAPRPVQLISVAGGLGLPSTIENGEAGLLQIHGTDDEVVPYLEAEQIHDRAGEVGLDFQLETIEGGDHDVQYDAPSVIGGGATIMDRILSRLDEKLDVTSDGSGSEDDGTSHCDDGLGDDDTGDDDFLREDVDRDRRVSLIDALRVINHLYRNTDGLGLDHGYDADVNDDGSVTLLDALLVINYLARDDFNSGEGEAFGDAASEEEEWNSLEHDLLNVLANDQSS
ncbi:MAG: G8 domain-containing protein [Planctomycetota bacterium]